MVQILTDNKMVPAVIKNLSYLYTINETMSIKTLLDYFIYESQRQKQVISLSKDSLKNTFQFPYGYIHMTVEYSSYYSKKSITDNFFRTQKRITGKLTRTCNESSLPAYRNFPLFDKNTAANISSRVDLQCVFHDNQSINVDRYYVYIFIYYLYYIDTKIKRN